MNEDWKKEVLDSLFIHSPLPLRKEHSLEAEFSHKKVTKTKYIWENAEGDYSIQGEKQGSLSFQKDNEELIITLTASLCADTWPEGAPLDGDYSNYGIGMFKFMFQNENWEDYNRLRFWVKPKIFGARILHLNVSVKNNGKRPVPDPYFREGATVYDLENHVWQECFWEFSNMGRDAVTELSFYVYLSGKDITGDDFLTYEFKDIRLEHVTEAELEMGWECRKNQIVLSTLGYFIEGNKTAIANGDFSSFMLIDAETKQIVFQNSTNTIINEMGIFQVFDFTDVTQEGLYYIESSGVKSTPFYIRKNLLEESIWKTINFLYCERCGTPVAHRHGSCHLDTLAEHNGVKISFAGGWHDAGDVSQQAVQTGEVAHALLETAIKAKNDTFLYHRLLEEAQWGMDFILRTRFGDGYRATSAGATRFTAGKIGDMDDISVRVFDHSYENFLFAGIEAYAGYVWLTEDPEYAYGLIKAAKEDFLFAEEKFQATGVDPANIYEHTFHSGESQYYAVMTWAAANLHQVTKDTAYGKKAATYAQYLLECQETGEANLPFTGFFYRNKTKREIVHFNHQVREHQFIQALDLLCRTQPAHEDFPKWEQAMKRYVGYLEYIIPHTSPYGMLPAGVYRMDEPENKKTFEVMNILVDYEAEKENYHKQLKAGKQVDDMHVIRNFPVWFSFRGNTAVHLSMGKAASILGHYFHNNHLLQAGREQFYWIFGKNPFGQSLQYGVGRRYCSQYAVLAGESVGELPVGIETYENEDTPYWPQNNNATYKEVWTSSASRFLWLAADYVDPDSKGSLL